MESNENDVSTDSTTEVEEPTVIVKKDHPIIRMFAVVTASLVGIVVFLFVLGFVLARLGHPVPPMDIQILWDQLEDAVPSASQTPGASESQSPTPTNPPTVTASPTETSAPNVEAREAGQEAGEIFKQYKDSADDFWKGFNEASR